MPLIQRLDARAERGFSMFSVIMAMFVTAMFVAASFAAVNGDLPVSGASKDRKATYAAAEAGLNFYLNHLQQDPDYWTLCDKAPDPNATEKSPINLQWDGGGTDPRTWRTIPGSTAQYTIELLDTKNFTSTGCVRTDQRSIIDESTGTFRIRFTGRPHPGSNVRRSIVTTFRRDSFLNFVYYTQYESQDPASIVDSTARATAISKCADKVRSARIAAGCPSTVSISFPDNDKVNGPLHTQDESVYVCGDVTFGRSVKMDGTAMNPMNDRVEVRGPGPAHLANPNGGSGCNDGTVVNTERTPKDFILNAPDVQMPQSNQKLADVAAIGGAIYKGKTIVRLNGSTMDVTNFSASGTPTTTTGVAWPNNGVLYVDNAVGTCQGEFAIQANYDEEAACGNVYVSGTYSKSLTIAARGDIILRPTLNARLDNSSSDADLRAAGGSDATLGLIADGFVRVGHRVNRTSGGACNGNASSASEPMVNDVQIDAAILSVKHSFVTDNWDCGKAGTLTIVGAITQKYRGIVCTFQNGSVITGYTKDYWYDDRLKYRSPPYFLAPVDSAWDVVRLQELVPAR
jgi:hypothetical protein